MIVCCGCSVDIICLMVWSDEVEGKRELMFGVMTFYFICYLFSLFSFQNALLYNTQ